MSIFTQSAYAIGFVALVAGCSQQEEDYAPIAPDPVYNKYGVVMSDEGGCARNGSCKEREYKIPQDEPEGGGGGNTGGGSSE